MAFFGAPAKYNKWFGNELLIPTAGTPGGALLNPNNPTQTFYPNFGQSAPPPPAPPPVPQALSDDEIRRRREALEREGGAAAQGDQDSHVSTPGTASSPYGFGDMIDDQAYAKKDISVPTGLLSAALWAGHKIGQPIAQHRADEFAKSMNYGDPIPTLANKAEFDARKAAQKARPTQTSFVSQFHTPEAVAADPYSGENMSEAEFSEAVAAAQVADAVANAAAAADISKDGGPGIDAFGGGGGYGGMTSANAPAGGIGGAHGVPGDMSVSFGQGTVYGGAGNGTMSDGGADPGGDGTVICTALWRQGMLPEEVYLVDAAYGLRLDATDPAVRRGYQRWATPIARLMEKSRTVAALVAPLAIPWAQHLYGNENWLGALYMKIGVPICRWLGRSA